MTERNPYAPPQAEVRDDEVPTLARTLSLRYGTLALGLPSTLLVFVWAGATPYPLIVFGLIGIALIFGRDRRCLHDLIARTKVVAVARSPVTSA
jgi:hypothetical protein